MSLKPGSATSWQCDLEHASLVFQSFVLSSEKWESSSRLKELLVRPGNNSPVTSVALNNL